MSKNIKLQKSLVLTLKVTLFIVFCYLLYQQISKLTLEQFQSITIDRPLFLFFTFLLFFMNWGFEFLKWLKIIQVYDIKLSGKKLLSSFFSGITTGVVTPNRIGNFIGRIIYFKGKLRAQIVLGTLYSNFSQFLVTLLFGIPSFIYLYDIVFYSYGNKTLYLSLVFLFLSVLFYFSVPFLKFKNIPLLTRKLNVLTQFQEKSKKLYLSFILFSTGRFIAFSLQYFCFLVAFGVAFSFDLLMAIFMFYLISTLIPTLFLSKLVVREATGLFILSFFVENSAIIVVSSLLLWVVNLGVPAIIGMYFILKKKNL